jgi:hypothetical protein
MEDSDQPKIIEDRNRPPTLVLGLLPSSKRIAGVYQLPATASPSSNRLVPADEAAACQSKRFLEKQKLLSHRARENH